MLKQLLFRRSLVCSRRLTTDASFWQTEDSSNSTQQDEEDDALILAEFESLQSENNIFNRVLHKKRCVPIPVRERVADVKILLPGLRVGAPFFEDMIQPDATANEELCKIPNFLHLSPPMVEAHTRHLKELCTPCPERPKRPIKIYKTNYAFVGPSMKQPMSRNVSIKVDINDLNIKEEDRTTFEKLVTAHPKDDFTQYHRVGKHPRRKAVEYPVLTKLEGSTLTITGQQCPTRDQNTSLCFYRLSGFLDEAPRLRPITETLTISNNMIAFVCGFTVEEVVKFFNERSTGIELSGDGSIQITGSETAVSAVVEYLTEMRGNLAEVQLDIPPQLTDYIQYDSKEMERILSEYDIFLAPDNSIVGNSDVIAQCSLEIADYVAKLGVVEVALEPKYALGLPNNDKFKRIVANLDCQVEVSPSGLLTAILDCSEEGGGVEKLNEIIQQTLEDVEERFQTITIPCQCEIPQHIKDMINVHIEHDGNTIIATGEIAELEDLKSFIEKKTLHG